jgi:autotransporter-associated beta strand protein
MLVKRSLYNARVIVCFWAAAMGVAADRDALATPYFWDTNGSTAGVGSAGGGTANWLDDHWSTSSLGTLPTAAWPNTQPSNGDAAVFLNTPGMVNVHDEVFVNAIYFSSRNYTIASTGGVIHLVGDHRGIVVNPASLPGDATQIVTISAPILSDSGFTLLGNGLSGGHKFLVLDNTDSANPNAFSGKLTIDAGGALRLGGGVGNEQIPDDVDLDVFGVIDFHTTGGASDGKKEKVRNVLVSGPVANFSVGNEADFVVNSITAASNGNGQGISLNGGTATSPNDPGRLIINGWANGAGHLTLDDGRVRINTTISSFGIGGRVLLAGNIYSSGNSEIWNHNGGPITPEDHVFTHKALDFTSEAHTIDVSSGTLLMTSRAAIQPLDVTSTHPGGTTLTKTGAGVWLYEHAIQSSFTGTNRIEQGTLRLGASERLANGSRLEVAGGTFDMQGFSERVTDVLLESGLITATGGGTLTSATIETRGGVVQARLGGAASLTKTTAGTVQLQGANSYGGTTTVAGGTLLVNGSHTGGGAYSVDSGATLGGNGSINANVTVNGTLAPGTSVGVLTVNGNVAFGAGSRLAIELSGALADKIVVDGDLDLTTVGSALEVTGIGTGDSWVIATYTGGLSGNFDSITAGYSVDYGTGANSQITLIVAPLLIGDYNQDGTVDAADYSVWRNSLDGPGSSLANREPANGSGPVSAADYDSWKSHYGDTLVGAGGGPSKVAHVPEPEVGWLLALGLPVLFPQRFIADQ